MSDSPKAGGAYAPLLSPKSRGNAARSQSYTSEAEAKDSQPAADQATGQVLAPVPLGEDALVAWEFPGWGSATVIDQVPEEELRSDVKPHKFLDQFRATAISGNDITSSCLYTAGLCAVEAGQLSPFCLIIVAFILYLYRRIYGEVCTALPVNGGAYNALLNTTTKGIAALAACLTLLSYVATAVVSGTEACAYVKSLWEEMNIEIATIIVLFVFALLAVWGITESSTVALLMFIFHMVTLITLIVCSIKFTVEDKAQILKENWSRPLPRPGFNAVFFGTAAALLGISGFETSANFIEEQGPRTFLRNLRNMWFAVAFFNPVISFFSLAVLPLPVIYEHTDDLLAEMGQVSGGNWLKVWISVDAAVVLSGAVLTAYVGVTGLMKRMALDRCLPMFLLAENKCRHTNHWIIFVFFLVASSLFLILNGNVSTLSGVYNLAFLSVMALFAIGCILLKWKRPHIPRVVKSGWTPIFIALILVILGLIGNILRNPKVVQFFILYFAATVFIVLCMFQRTRILRLCLAGSQGCLKKLQRCNQRCGERLRNQISKVNQQSVVFFLKRADLVLLNKAVLYVRQNEQTHRLTVVHCYEPGSDIQEDLARKVALLDAIYPKLRIDLLLVQGEFGPPMIQWLSKRLAIPQNMMFISCPDKEFPHKFDTLGGVRVITTSSSKGWNNLPPSAVDGQGRGSITDAHIQVDVHGLSLQEEKSSASNVRGPLPRTLSRGVRPGELIEDSLLLSIPTRGEDLANSSLGRAAGINSVSPSGLRERTRSASANEGLASRVSAAHIAPETGPSSHSSHDGSDSTE